MKKNTFSLLAIILLISTLSCEKESLSVSLQSNRTVKEGNSLVYHEPGTDVTIVITTSYDYELKEYKFAASEPLPCKLTFKIWNQVGGAPWIVNMSYGQTVVSYPFPPYDDNESNSVLLFADYCERLKITNIQHWKVNGSVESSYTVNSVTYYFVYNKEYTQSDID